MKRNIQLLVYSLIVIGVLTACDLETEKAGRVEGMWHLEQVDSLQTGKVCDLSRRRLFWSFERKLMSLTDADGHNVEYLMRFEDTGDSLWVSDPYESNREKGDIAVSDAAVLHPCQVRGCFFPLLVCVSVFVNSNVMRSLTDI